MSVMKEKEWTHGCTEGRSHGEGGWNSHCGHATLFNNGSYEYTKIVYTCCWCSATMYEYHGWMSSDSLHLKGYKHEA